MSECKETPMAGQDGVAPPLDRRVLAIAVVVLGAIMTILDTTLVAIDTLSRDFGASLPTIQWIATAHMLALATVRLPYVANTGRLVATSSSPGLDVGGL